MLDHVCCTNQYVTGIKIDCWQAQCIKYIRHYRYFMKLYTIRALMTKKQFGKIECIEEWIRKNLVVKKFALPMAGQDEMVDLEVQTNLCWTCFHST